MKFKSAAPYARSGVRLARPNNLPWTPQEIENCMKLYDDDHSIEDIAESLARGTGATNERVHIELRKRQAAEEGRTYASSKISAPLAEERDRRKAGYDARDITSTFFGDPPRGFSALDKQRETSGEPSP